MEIRSDFLQWLSMKLFLITIGMYATIGSIMVLPVFLTKALGISPGIASFTAFFVVAFIRAAYESLIVYEVSIKSVPLSKMLFLVLVTSSVMSFVSHLLKPLFGYFTMPVSIIIAFIVVGKLKVVLWPTIKRSCFFEKLAQKQSLQKFSMYGFYAILVGITSVAYGKYDFNFYYAFAVAYFIGVIVEELYNLMVVYDLQPNVRSIISMVTWAIACAVTSTVIVSVLMNLFLFQGQAATIVSVIVLKLIQPLGIRIFIVGYKTY